MAPLGQQVIRSFASLFLVVLAEPISSTILLPFVYFLVRDFGYAERDIGAHAGLITSAFFAAQIFATPPLSLLSDRAGRKPILMFGLLGSAVSMVLFGLSPNLAWAILVRTLCGVVNGNFAVARTMVAELASSKGVAPARAFSLFGFCLAAGWLVGPAIGGALANSYTEHGWAGPWSLWQRYPYLLPCVVSATFNVICCLQCFFFLEETRKPTATRDSNDERAPLLVPQPKNNRIDAVGTGVEADGPSDEEMVTPKQYSLKSTQIACLCSASLFFVQAIMFDELFPLFAAASATMGDGLSFKSTEIASALTVAGPTMLLALLLYPKLSAKRGILPLWRWSALILALDYLVISLMPSTAAWPTPMRWAALCSLLGLRYATLIVGLTSGNIMLNLVATNEDRAFINGIGQSVGSMARAVGPALAGFLWSSSTSNSKWPLGHHVTFLLIAIICGAQAITSFFIRLNYITTTF